MDILGLVREVAASLEGSHDWSSEHHVRVCSDSGPLYVVGDPVQLRQCFLNLGRNAAEAMPDGGALRVTVFSSDCGRVEVDFTDQGEGMAEDQLSRIFDPFYSTKPPGKGTGLGLAISLRIIETFYGTIHVESTEGKGSTFTVKFPVWEPDHDTK